MTILRPALAESLRALKLSGMLETLDARLDQAQGGDLGYLEFLQILCDDEITRREAQGMVRRLRRARFDLETTLEGFDFTASPKLPAAQIRDLAALRWLHAGESIILYGAVGVGKTHVAQALGHQAIRAGAEARFHKTSRILADLAGGHADRTFEKRLAGHVKVDLLILDDFAMREFTPTQADDLYEADLPAHRRGPLGRDHRQPCTPGLVSALPQPGRSRIPSRPADQPSHQVFMNGPSFRPNKRPKATITVTK